MDKWTGVWIVLASCVITGRVILDLVISPELRRNGISVERGGFGDHRAINCYKKLRDSQGKSLWAWYVLVFLITLLYGGYLVLLLSMLATKLARG